MTEAQVKSKLVKWLEDRGYWTLLLIQTNKPGIPDVLAIDTKSQSTFIEVKRPGKKARQLQEYRIKELRKQGIPAFVFDGDFTDLAARLAHGTDGDTF